MKQAKRKFTAVAGLLLAGTVALSACGGNSANSGSEGSSGAGKSESVTIKYYNWDNEAQAVATDAMLDEFMTKNPDIKVEHVVLVPGDSVEMLKKLDFLISSGEAVDVVAMPSLGAVYERATRGALASLNDFYKQENLVPEDEYYVNPKINDNYYGMQLTSSFNYVLLNKDALDEAGLPVPTYGWTWDDYRDYAKKLTKGEGVDKRYGTYFHTWELYMNAPAQTVMKDPFRYDDGSTILSDPSYKYFFQLRKDMESVDKSAKPYADVLAAKLNYRTEFFNEQAAMIWCCRRAMLEEASHVDETAGRLGLHVIVRPSPYICAEWETPVPDRNRLLQRSWLRRHLMKRRTVLALPGHILLPPKTPQQLVALLHRIPLLLFRDSEERVMPRIIAFADNHLQSSAGQMIKRRIILGDPHRIQYAKHRYSRQQSNA